MRSMSTKRAIKVFIASPGDLAVERRAFNLGNIVKLRGKLDEARRLWTHARDLFGKIGAKPMEQIVQEWLDGQK